MNGKGDTPRPLSVPRKEFESNWDLAFGQKSEKVPELKENVALEKQSDTYGVSIIEKCRQPFMLIQKFNDHFKPFEEYNDELHKNM